MFKVVAVGSRPEQFRRLHCVLLRLYCVPPASMASSLRSGSPLGRRKDAGPV
ncbi:hypothetical protein DPMN_082841 [Dreissena polymorpha]|uniref:Uncharacterized protein n=1 Tax=Dreissena polymorpha TaxID=45954 RepID=A0A9D3Y7M3_DREPO|nr:hypothetical protein DPMN_082841 [Dreissena polymorpha]